MKLFSKLAILLSCFVLFACAPTVQGWNKDETAAWYVADQGSRLVPQSWIDNLEEAGSAQPFLDSGTIYQKYRYLPGMKRPDQGCPAGAEKTTAFDSKLPLGFVVDCQDDSKLTYTKLRWKPNQGASEPWVGMTCAACHTGQITYKGTAFRIEGGPTLADFQGFMAALEDALDKTGADKDKFGRFAAKVLGADNNDANRDRLQQELKKLVTWNANLERLNHADIRYGYGRLDAVGHILNKAALLAMQDAPKDQLPNPADAPVSYPFLWNTPHLNKVEWDGILDNGPELPGVTVGSLGRNAGEVIGVFGDVAVAKPAGALDGYVSSVKVDTLVQIENQVAYLRAPAWPEAFGKPDPKLVEQGRKVYDSYCVSCHELPRSSWLSWIRPEHYKVWMVPVFKTPVMKYPDDFKTDRPVGTDSRMACNVVLDKSKPGKLKDALPADKDGTVVSLTMTQNEVVQATLHQWPDILGNVVEGIFHVQPGLPRPPPEVKAAPPGAYAAVKTADQVREDACKAIAGEGTAQSAMIAYKARPLQGIWATAPYLHNGSVVSLAELLRPSYRRVQSFQVGTTEFQPEVIGFSPDAGAAGNDFTFDTSKAGNSNNGHDYGTEELEADAKNGGTDRKALLEFLKTL